MSSDPANTNPAPETQPEAAAPAAPAPAAPNMAGLPAIKKASVIGAEGDAPRGPRFGGDRGGDRGPRKGPPRDDREKAPDTRAHLDHAKSEKAADMDAELNKEIEMMLSASADEEHKPKSRIVGGAPAGGKPAIRGPRVVQSGREYRTGKVVSVGPSDIFIEFGPKELGVCQRIQFKDDEVPAVGAEIEVVVERFSAEESLFICRKPGSVQKAAWEMLEVGQVVEARVTGTNKGGLELEVAGHKAFMPASQASLDRVADLSVFVGEKFPCTVVQLDRRGAGNIVLSRRDMLKEERKAQAEKLKGELTEGATMEGTVRKIMPFGAFIDLGGIDGLCHISDMTWDRVAPTEKNVQKYVKEGDKVKVKILKLDIEGKRISLGMKQLSDDPFSVAAKDIVEGAEVMGKVVRMTEFGVFLEIAPGVDGLVHISEIARRRINKPEDVLKQDEVVKAKVLKVDPQTRKISLSIKAMLPEEAPRVNPRDARGAEKAAERAKRDAERLAELSKETPELRRKRESFRGKELKGGFGKEDGSNPFGLTLGMR
jgi:small subunit ribosomal protein S1